MIVLGIDYGDKRVGIAKCDALMMLATGLDTIVRKNDSMKQLAEIIASIITKYNVEKIVLGMPKNMDGTLGERANKTILFADKLAKYTNVDIIFWDERLTSKAAHRNMHERGIKTGHNKGKVDKIAACYILQSYLDSI
ncbi:MAG: Holliday junction resolvase RuvX [Clostridiales bacterium]|nr:Holliday junction resolvase RuvX [Clostridiales bacterium]